IVALGESIVAIGVGVAHLPISWPIVTASVLGLVVSGALWWAYFDVTALLTERALSAADGGRQIRLARGGSPVLAVTTSALTHLVALLPALVALAVLAVVLSALIGYETFRYAELRRQVRGAAHED